MNGFWTFFGRFLDVFLSVFYVFWTVFGRFLAVFLPVFGRFWTVLGVFVVVVFSKLYFYRSDGEKMMLESEVYFEGQKKRNSFLRILI